MGITMENTIIYYTNISIITILITTELHSTQSNNDAIL